MEIHCSPEVSSEYLDEVWEILREKEFLSLCQYCHHQRSNRLLHSLNVSYISWKIAKRFGCDERAAARAGLLHDFCPYDFSEETPTGERQVFYHPKAAAENSSRHFEISRKEREAILTHMFPLGPVPTNREGWIISFADKICAVMEVCNVAIALARHNRVVVVSAAA